MRKSGQWEWRDHVWVTLGGQVRWKGKQEEEARSAVRAHQVNSGSDQAAAAAFQRVGNFVTFGGLSVVS